MMNNPTIFDDDAILTRTRTPCNLSECVQMAVHDVGGFGVCDQHLILVISKLSAAVVECRSTTRQRSARRTSDPHHV